MSRQSCGESAMSRAMATVSRCPVRFTLCYDKRSSGFVTPPYAAVDPPPRPAPQTLSLPGGSFSLPD